ncbi:hypothetical protein GIB67_028953 [Kingdonia uniflora]|uniref:ER lumen protein retaining receptor n=1 Tax=Kingdonia uniflora TaxID=39325 RepID=A0A7J7LBW7_9MAGN|nr:hypothetical protein GIB67_028953 [Kingdonia uniflora]
MGRRRGFVGFNVLFGWVRKQSMKVKIFMGLVFAICSLGAMEYFVNDYYNFFIASELIHAVGIMVLVYKLTTKRNCSGLSLKSQEITAIFLAARMYCSIVMELDIHTFLDFASLITTVWVIYMIRFKLKATYIKDLDTMKIYYAVVPTAILAVLVHPYSPFRRFDKMCWAFCVYLESVSVLPQLRLMQNAKMVEPFTGHYVFALGLSRVLSFASWILRKTSQDVISLNLLRLSCSHPIMYFIVDVQIVRTGRNYLLLGGANLLWLIMALLSEIVQTFILADFCYYYVKRSALSFSINVNWTLGVSPIIIYLQAVLRKTKQTWIPLKMYKEREPVVQHENAVIAFFRGLASARQIDILEDINE